MQETCPISEEQINLKIVRSNATLVSITLGIYLFTGNISFILFLVIDFFIRGFRQDLPSPFGILSRSATKLLNLENKPINAAPKLFAAKIGFIFSTLIAFFSYFDFALTSHLFASVMFCFSLLESILGFCIACRIYSICCSLGLIK